MRIVLDDSTLYGDKCEVEVELVDGTATVHVQLTPGGPRFIGQHQLSDDQSREIVQAIQQLVIGSPATRDVRSHQVQRADDLRRPRQIIAPRFLGPRG